MDAPPGGAVFDGGAACTAALCESFEEVPVGGKPDPMLWTTPADIKVDDLHPALGGKRALHLPPRGSGGSYITETRTIPGGGKLFYGRILFWFEQLPLQKPGSLYHWVMIAPQGGGMNLRIGGHVERDGSNWLRFNPGGPAGETGLSDLTAVMVARRWYCLEWFFDTPNNEARFWLDGQERPVLHWKDSVAGWHFPPAGITSLGFGFEEYQGAPSPFELFIDELALGTQRIGCGGAPVLADPSDPSSLKAPAAGQGNGVPCGGNSCAAGQKCCTDQTHGSFNPRCVAGGTTCLAASAQMSCDGPEDCPGQLCCVETASQISGCQASCETGTFARLCHAAADCGTGQMCCPTNFTPNAGIRYGQCRTGGC
ncbi:MAG TPA: hypothetical protein VNO55_22605 [Polyangia bacterium]|nr:hypothetical protein [Polyangia bacterium]